MNDAQYQELLNKSISFKGLSSDDQKKISSATEGDRAKYAVIFQEEIQMLEEASKTFLTQNDVVINQFKHEVKKDKQSKLKNAEKKAETAEINKAEDLLKQI